MLKRSGVCFSSFAVFKDEAYKRHVEGAAPFVSNHTFIKFFYAWKASFKYDFRLDQDPFCQCDPNAICGDGTDVGLNLDEMCIRPMETSDEGFVPVSHKRYDRTFIFEKPNASQSEKGKLASARNYLRKISEAVKKSLPLAEDLNEEENLFKALPSEILRF